MELAFIHDNVPLEVHHNRKARRYLLRIRHDGTLRVTIPRYGNREEAMRFVARQNAWIIKQRARMLERKRMVQPVIHGSLIWYHGEKLPLSVQAEAGVNVLRFGDQQLSHPTAKEDWRTVIDVHLRALASADFPQRVHELASQHGLEVKRVSVRDQKSRWGSCSVRKTVSLNWRLIQAPSFVLDYVIVHELMHLKEMNHSVRFWQLVAAAFPPHSEAEHWLKQHGQQLR